MARATSGATEPLMASVRTPFVLLSFDIMIAIFKFCLSLGFVKRTLLEARLCLFRRTGLRRFVAGERFSGLYNAIVFPEFQNLRISWRKEEGSGTYYNDEDDVQILGLSLRRAKRGRFAYAEVASVCFPP
jgi:hypothetical protein